MMKYNSEKYFFKREMVICKRKSGSRKGNISLQGIIFYYFVTYITFHMSVYIEGG